MLIMFSKECRLKEIFGSVPEVILQNIQHLSTNGDHFYCTPCGRNIKKVENSLAATENHFRSHLASRNHDSKTSNSNKTLSALEGTFGTIPQFILNNLKFLECIVSNFYCILCNKNLIVSKDSDITLHNFSVHLLSNSHEEKLDQIYDTREDLEEFFGCVPTFVMNNIEYISIKGNHFYCNICEKHIRVHPTEVKMTERNFSKHLNSFYHIKNAKHISAFSVLPQLKEVFQCLPYYIESNIDYITNNDTDFYCLLCNENIYANYKYLYMTANNLQYHFQSNNHTNKLLNRRDTDNIAFNRLCELYEDLNDDILGNLQYLSVNVEDYYCNVCKQTIEDDSTRDNIEQNLNGHFASHQHKSCCDNEIFTMSTTKETLESVFGSVPEMIIDNLKYIRIKGKYDFMCILCNKTLKVHPTDRDITQDTFEKHLNSNVHQEKLSNTETQKVSIEEELETLFDCVPQYITNNIQHLGVESDGNFFCYLCNKHIKVHRANEKVTEVNFRSHLKSFGHSEKLKQEAKLICLSLDKLQHTMIFGSVPYFILNNLKHIESNGDDFYCTLCDKHLEVAADSLKTANNFKTHLAGSIHQSNITDENNDSALALERLSKTFWQIPEFMLVNLDFFVTVDSNFYCRLCQCTVYENELDLKEMESELREHVYSQYHQEQLKIV